MSRPLASFVDLAGKLVVGFTVGSYLIGFIIAGTYYERFGVPVYALPHELFLAAGLAWLVVTGSVAVAALSVRWKMRAAHWRDPEFYFDLVMLFGMPLFFASQLFDGFHWTILSYLATIFAFLAFSPPGHWFVSPSTDRWPLTAWAVLRVAFLLLATVATFATSLLPRIPHSYGGAKMDLLASVTLDHAAVAPVEHDRWMQLTCRTSKYRIQSVESMCQRIFRVHESQAHMYLLVQEVEGACEHSQPEPPTHPNDGTCVVRIAEDTVPTLELTR
jgi:hypothetical protein